MLRAPSEPAAEKAPPPGAYPSVLCLSLPPCRAASAPLRHASPSSLPCVLPGPGPAPTPAPPACLACPSGTLRHAALPPPPPSAAAARPTPSGMLRLKSCIRLTSRLR